MEQGPESNLHIGLEPLPLPLFTKKMDSSSRQSPPPPAVRSTIEAPHSTEVAEIDGRSTNRLLRQPTIDQLPISSSDRAGSKGREPPDQVPLLSPPPAAAAISLSPRASTLVMGVSGAPEVKSDSHRPFDADSNVHYAEHDELARYKTDYARLQDDVVHLRRSLSSAETQIRQERFRVFQLEDKLEYEKILRRRLESQLAQSLLAEGTLRKDQESRISRAVAEALDQERRR
jgi:hypothetical protein